MKSKGAVKFFAIALAVVCLFQLSFTFIAGRIEKKADNYAQGDPVKKRRYLDSVSRETAFNIGIRKYTYLDVKERELNLGLDLRGGMHVTLEVAMEKFLKELSGNNADPVFNKALANAKQAKVTSQRSFVDIFVDEIQRLKPNAQLAPYFATIGNKENIKINSSNDEVVTYLKKESQSALERTFEILRARVDKFGVTQPNVQPDFTSGRITVEMPGIDDADRVRKLLKGSAKLEFYETYTLAEIFPFMQDADKALLAIQEVDKVTKTGTNNTAANMLTSGTTDSTKNDTTAKVDDTIKSSNPLAGITKTNDTAGAKNDSLGKETPLLSALFPFQISNDMAQSPTIGWVRISDTARVNKLLNTPEVKDAFPPETKLLWSSKPTQQSDLLELTALKTTGLVGKEAVLYGDAISDANADIDPQSNAYIVSMQMNPQGAADWARITKAAAAMNPKGHIAIVLDDQVYSAPRVQNEITGGRSQITGNFTASESKDLANILKAGKLPVELQVIDEAVVGPSLGQEAINTGLLSLAIGVGAIALFMVLYYNRSGWVANLALFVNLFFIIGILTSLGAALTMPGMAGIVLTLAMAVDANVLIYERIREELALGKNLKMAIADGFQHALPSIIDGNLTTLLIGIILMAFGGRGPIYGFAVVLVIGILTSLFTAILVSRLIFEWLLEKDSKINFGNKTTNNLFKNINYDFVGKRKYAYWFSGITTLIGIISLAVNGLNYGVDFEGGRSYILDFEKPVQTEEVRSVLTKAFGDAPEIKTFGSDDKLSITTNYMKDGGEVADKQVSAKLMEGLGQLNDNPAKIVNTQLVGSTIASDIKNSAFYSILFGLLAVFLYIVVRFKRWQFAAGATIALAHDVFFVLTLFSLFKDWLPFTSVDQAVVAALLTVVGYSINDTVVVFDRIREFLRNNRKSAMVPTVNAALNTTLSRTIITALTVWIAVFILFLVGGPIIRGFSFAMLIGVTVGVYSSIFVATPLALDFQKKSELESSTF
ncbi:MAG: protein translocase subunit SecDF [Sphingobacteriales bacterium]|nr:MAG: protein translocase subunit SecDF [Sphingobacteriales bacterium]